ncbi:protein kinase domain-containing protein [Pseudactinotalea sp. Z1748]|uniref:protein kinase domain-containing protein n=1 Tax=Pseudactinotalea sp. Z1748 TaxID=3413027 RepID=UPI003C7B7905
MSSSPDTTQPVPREVGGYRLRSVLGSGGMGTVYEALDGDNRVVALKLLHPGISADPAARARLRREIATLHRVRGPHVARVLDAESDSAEAFIVTELVEGQSLDDSVREHGPLDEVEVADLADGLADALAAIHGAGVVHRDLKPGNVMLTDAGPVVIDFGISQLADDSRLTQTGLVTGTPGYVDPAVMRGSAPGITGDWWGWAAILLFALTGRAPFGKGPLAAVLGRVETGRPDLDGVPEPLAPVLRAALHPDPQHRLDPREVRKALGEFALGHTPTVVIAEHPTVAAPQRPPAPPAFPPHRRSAWPAGAAGAGTAGVQGPGPAAGYPPQSQAQPPAQHAPGEQQWQQAPVTPAPTRRPVQPVHPAPAGPEGWQHPQEQAPAPMPAWARRPRTRPAVLGAWFLAVVGLGALRPAWTLIGLAVVMALTGAIGVGAEALRERRMHYGRRRSDSARVIAGSPWYLLSGTLLTVPGLMVGALAAVVIWGLGASRLPHTGVVALAMAALTLLLWWIPSSTSARTGARHVLAVLAPSARVARIWAGAGVLVGLVMLLAVAGFGAEVVWDPAPAPAVPTF